MKKLLPDKIALVYDRVNKYGGAERVLLALRELLGPDLYTLVYNPKKAGWSSVFDVHPSFFNRIPWFRDRHEFLATFAAIGFESFDFGSYKVVVSVTSSDAKAIITRPGTVHVCYCLTPPRYLWEMEDLYSRRPGLGWASRAAGYVFTRVAKRMRDSDLVYASRPDVYIAISKEVQKRIRKAYGRESVVVYPPVEWEFFSKIKEREREYYLVVSRLVPYKKTALVVRAFNKLGYPLVVVGEGSEKSRLMAMAGENITFTGWVSDERLREYYAGAKALIFPQIEDFGITPLEAQSCGTPVIAFGQGGVMETVLPGKTGVFFGKQRSGAIMEAVKRFQKTDFDHNACRENARRFGRDRFIKNFEEALNSAIEK